MRPHILIPTVTENPIAGFGLLNALLDAAQAFLLGVYFAVDFLQTERILLQMQMRVGETRGDHAPTHVFFLRFWIFIQQIVRFADREDAFAVNDDGGCGGLRRVLGDDAGVVEEDHV